MHLNSHVVRGLLLGAHLDDFIGEQISIPNCRAHSHCSLFFISLIVHAFPLPITAISPYDKHWWFGRLYKTWMAEEDSFLPSFSLIIFLRNVICLDVLHLFLINYFRFLILAMICQSCLIQFFDALTGRKDLLQARWFIPWCGFLFRIKCFNIIVNEDRKK